MQGRKLVVHLSEEAFKSLRAKHQLGRFRTKHKRVLSPTNLGYQLHTIVPTYESTPYLSRGINLIPHLAPLPQWQDTRPLSWRQQDAALLQNRGFLQFNDEGGEYGIYLPHTVYLTDATVDFCRQALVQFRISPLSPKHRGPTMSVSAVVEAFALGYLSPPPTAPTLASLVHGTALHSGIDYATSQRINSIIKGHQD